MPVVLIAAILAFSLFAPTTAHAQARGQAPRQQAANQNSQGVQGHMITVSRSGEAFAKPDLGILIMSIHSVSPIAAEAVEANDRKAKAAASSLTELAFPLADYQVTAVTFGQSRGPGGMRLPGQSDVIGYAADQYVYVFFQAADLPDMVKLTQKTASVIEALRKAGAVPANMGPTFGNMFPGAAGSLMIYTVKDPAPFEHQAMQVAISRARDAAQDIATATGAQIAGLRNVQAGYLGGNVVPRSGTSPLEGLKFRWYTTKSDELQIIANAMVEYDFQ